MGITRYMKHRIKIALFAVLTLLLFLLNPSPLLSSMIEIPSLQRGVCYVTWDEDRFSTQYSDRSLEKLSTLGADYISVVATHYQENPDSTEIKRTANTPSDKSVMHVIKKAHKLGMKVMLKPHVDLINRSGDTYWRGDIGFCREDNWRKWFSEYKDFILHYARIADRMGVDIFCIGTELSFTTQKNDLWEKEVIQPVKNIYSGKLIYAANWDNYMNIRFWKYLDYVGIDAYFPLSHKTNPSLSELCRGWERWKQEIRAWHTRTNKPIIFTEIGYPSISHAPVTPWKSGERGNANTEIQARCYKAFFETIWGCPWLKGVYWWKWDTNIYAGGKHNRQFTPQNKPAEKILEMNYKGYRGNSTYAKADKKY